MVLKGANMPISNFAVKIELVLKRKPSLFYIYFFNKITTLAYVNDLVEGNLALYPLQKFRISAVIPP